MTQADAAPITFARTRIQPPRPRADLVARPALENMLTATLASANVTLLAAPAGSGKTVAMSQQLARLAPGTAVAWVSLDEDDDAPLLMACLIAALDPFDLPWRIAPDALVAAAAQPATQREAVGRLVNALAAAEAVCGVLVFDDVHRLRDAAALALIAQLVERLPSAWSVVLLSRNEPALPLARWRARGELAELRAADLRFDSDEVARWTGLAADDPRVADLLARTDGWAAGLRLSLQVAPGAGRAATLTTQRHLFDYLASEVFDTLPPPLQAFLLRTSVLPELTATRTAAVSGDARAALWLDDIERRGLFVTALDSDEPTLRLHDLFREFLEDRLQREHAAELPSLFRHAAAGEDDAMRRVGWLLRAGDVGSAEQTLLQSAPALLAAGAGAPVLRLIEQFPPGLRALSPQLAYVRGLIAWPRFEWVTMAASMQRAAPGFAQAGMDALARRTEALAIVAATAVGDLDGASARLAALREQVLERDTEALVWLMGYWETGARGPADGPARHLGTLIGLLTGERAASAGPAGLAGIAPPPLWAVCVPHFMLVGRPGLQAPMARWIALALSVAGDSHAPLRCAAQMLAAWLALWQGRLDDAEQLAGQAQADARWLGEPRSLRIPILALRAAASVLRGDRATLRQATDTMIEDVDRDPERRDSWRGVYLYLAAHFAAAVGDWAHARATTAALTAHPGNREWPCMGHARALLVARLALHDGAAAAAAQQLAPRLAAVDAVDALGIAAALRAVHAQAALQLHRPHEAAASLAPLLHTLADGGEPGPLLLAGADTLTALAQAPWAGALPAEAVARLQETAALARRLRGEPGAMPASAAATAGRPLQSELSEREAEVLERIAAGDSNKLIARAFDLSPHTVKRHVANILDKLDLASRGQAAAWYRAQAGRRP